MNIQDIREIMGLSQAQVADELGVPLQEVIDCEENGETYLLLQYISAFPINPKILTDPDADPFLPSFDQGFRRPAPSPLAEGGGHPGGGNGFRPGDQRGGSPPGGGGDPDLRLTRRRGEEIERKTGMNRKWLMYGDGRVKGVSRLRESPAPAPRASRGQKTAPNRAAGVRVREAREAAGISREELSDLVNLSVSRIAQMESGYVTDQKANHILNRIGSVYSPEEKEDPKAAGIRVRDQRKALGFSVRDAAEIVSLKPSTLAHMESGYITSRRADELVAALREAAVEKGVDVFEPRAAGQKIREARAAAGLSQKELGTILRMPVTRITHIELGNVTESEYEEIMRRIRREPRREIKVPRVKPKDQVLLGSNIRDLREEAGLSQKALGDLLQVPQTRVSLIERGKVDEAFGRSIIRKLNELIESRKREAEPVPAPSVPRKRPAARAIRSDLGEKIQKARSAAGLSQKALGELMGLSQGSISYLEQGKVDEETAGRVLSVIAENGKEVQA